MSQLNDILFYQRHPSFRGQLTDALKISGFNPSCGDKMTLYIKIENDLIIDARYDGQFCAIAGYGAELLIPKLLNKPLKEARGITPAKLLSNHHPLLNNPVRLKCFTQSIQILKTMGSK